MSNQISKFSVNRAILGRPIRSRPRSRLTLQFRNRLAYSLSLNDTMRDSTAAVERDYR
jgi:hypothetical protein